MILIDSNYLELKMHSQVNIRKMNYTKIVFFAFLTDSQKFKDDKNEQSRKFTLHVKTSISFVPT